MALPRRLTLGPLPPSLHYALQQVAANPLDAPASLDVTSVPAGASAIEAPFTGETIGYVKLGTSEDVDSAFAEARAAQAQWAATPVAERAAILLSFHDLVLQHRDILADMVQLETGKDRGNALDEVSDVALNARYYATQGRKLLADHRVRGALPVLTKTVVQRAPRGVVGQISPWNFPLTLGVSDAIPALMAGNAVVAKPDSNTPFTMLLAVHLLYMAGLPRNLFRVVTGPGRSVGNTIAQQCDYLMFTGSTATGRTLGKIAGERLIGYSAELGGKNPMIIAADAKLPAIMPQVISGCFANTGQLCVSIERIYVEAAIYDDFLRAFIAATRNLTIGVGFDTTNQVGSLASRSQLETVEKFVAQAREAGATVVAGGRHRPDLGPYFYEPTILTGAHEGVDLYRQEVFGPVVYVEKVATLDEAVARANDTEYGLNASVMGAPATAEAVARQIMAGSVTVNDGYSASWGSTAAPGGGMKASGMARRHGPEGLTKYTETRTVARQRGMSVRGPALLSNTAAGRALWSKVVFSYLAVSRKLGL